MSYPMCYQRDSRIQQLALVRLQRTLPEVAEIAVRIGDVVGAMDPIARAYTPGRWHYLDVARPLRTTPATVEAYLAKRPGQMVQAGEILASRKGALGLIRHACKAPAFGIVVAVEGGHIVLRELSPAVDVPAILRGRVAEIADGKVVIENTGTVVAGAWAAGPSTFGRLLLVADDPTTPFDAGRVQGDLREVILVAGPCTSADALARARQAGARGVILASLSPEILSQAETLGLALALVEGFGTLPMNRAAFDIFRASDGREAAMLCWPQDCRAGMPEIVIPQALSDAPAGRPAHVPMEVGQMVHLIGSTRLGQIGKIASISPVPARLETGMLFPALRVEIEGHGPAIVPWTNVEPIEVLHALGETSLSSKE